MNRTFLLFLLIIFTSFLKAQTVTIGTQVWMTKNLNLMTFRNGDSIPQAKTKEEWETAFKNEQPAWCYYDNNPANGEKYGILYNWYAVNDSRGLAPYGYHIPSKKEWETLDNFLGSNAGEKMKSAKIIVSKFLFIEEGGYYEQKYVPCSNCSYWTEKQKENNPCSSCKNTRGKTVSTGKYIPKTKKKIEEKNNIGWNGDNSSGFSGLPGGNCDSKEFGYIYDSGYWWSVTEGEEDENYSAYLRYLDNTASLNSDYFNKGVGLSVRCIKN